MARTLEVIRRWDHAAAQRDTRWVAISRISQERILRHWGREAPIVHPPVELDRFAPGAPEDWVLVVCELVRHKRVDDALKACRRAQVPVRVIGGGADEARLKVLHGDHAQFIGRLEDRALAELYPRAAAPVRPNVEEFGITAVEAQAAGRPVMALAAGGALETVVDGVTGVHVAPEAPNGLAEALRDTDLTRFDPAAAVANAQRFSVVAFQRGIRAQADLALAS